MNQQMRADCDLIVNAAIQAVLPDAAGGFVFGSTAHLLRKKGVKIENALENNDSYNCLNLVDGLIFTGPTGTNVNDLSVALIDRA